METSLVIKSKDTNQKDVTKSLTNINPNIGNTNLKVAAQMFTSISSGTYYDATRINKMNIDEEYAGTKIEPTLTVGSWSAITYQEKNGVQADITYNGDGNLFINTTKLATFFGSDPIKLFVGTTDSFTGTLYASEGTNYAAKAVEFSRNT